ncbi:IclR family transcriptional regulator [Leucobacter luti]|uniref:IclR family transcriptional regulator n=1 Tax=Leucobacter luti TaxID=340320 RepID=UPI00104B07C6|nr:IclR family transcriptional regulator [Leucobacter luti]MCW2288673.1 DNA-binding IclR family transcriptional regulator [Leucobacter luti]QYM75405.1 IclR family transcriptional regulator [Leucobacter luti]TCK45172.1 IclR family transcriptional regulator [Leucobacter luti]
MAATLNSVSKALDILHLLRARGPLKLSEIAAEIGVGGSSAHRLVSTLREQRFVRQEAHGKRYELGSAMLFTSAVSALEHCVAVSEPVMHELQRSSQETVHLTVLRGPICLFAASVESQQPVRVTSRVGQGPLAHTAAGGKVLLAALDSDRLAELYLRRPLEAATPESVTDPELLCAELTGVARLGYARNRGESEPDMYALAVPVRRPNGEVISSLTVAAPLSRMGISAHGDTLSPREKELLRQLQAAAGQIETLLAY